MQTWLDYEKQRKSHCNTIVCIAFYGCITVIWAFLLIKV
jgi:hypothetical protein